MKTPTRSALAALAALALLLGACSDDSDSSSDDAAASSGDAAAVGTTDSDFGEILVDGDGLTLYGFTPDLDAGAPTCEGDCATAWPPVTVDGDQVPEGLDEAVFSVVEHPDGGSQLAAGDIPLYRFAGDEAAGDTNGQGSGGTWFVVSADGELVEDGGAETEDADTSGGVY